MRLLAVSFALLLSGASTAAKVHIALVGRPPALAVGKTWTAKLTVRPKSFKGVVHVTATGPARVTARARGGHGSYRARLVFPKAGRWTLSARAGGSTSHLGTVQVRKPVEPLLFAWPTSIAVEASGSLLLVENGLGRVLRIDPKTGAETVLASQLSRPIAVTTTASGAILVSTENEVVRLGAGPPEVVATAAEDQIGPIVAAPNGDIYFTADTRAFRVPAGTSTPAPVADGLAAPHGLALAKDDALLISDTQHDAIRRVDPSTGALTTIAQVGVPDGIAVGPDGTIYVCDSRANRVVHLSATGERIGFIGPVFDTPYALAVAPDGGVYVVETSALGRVRHVAPDGTVTTLSSD